MQISKPYPYFFFVITLANFIHIVIRDQCFCKLSFQYFFVSYFASESLCSNGILLFAFLLQSVVRDDLSAGVLYWNAFFANCWTRFQGASTDPFALWDFQKTNIKSCRDPLTHQLICLHQHLDFYWMTGNTCDSYQDCEVDRALKR